MESDVDNLAPSGGRSASLAPKLGKFNLNLWLDLKIEEITSLSAYQRTLTT